MTSDVGGTTAAEEEAAVVDSGQSSGLGSMMVHDTRGSPTYTSIAAGSWTTCASTMVFTMPGGVDDEADCALFCSLALATNCSTVVNR